MWRYQWPVLVHRVFLRYGWSLMPRAWTGVKQGLRECSSQLPCFRTEKRENDPGLPEGAAALICQLVNELLANIGGYYVYNLYDPCTGGVFKKHARLASLLANAGWCTFFFGRRRATSYAKLCPLSCRPEVQPAVPRLPRAGLAVPWRRPLAVDRPG